MWRKKPFPIINRFPFFQQMDASDCGPACLQMIAKYYGKTYELQTLREYSFITREGVSMMGIADAAENIGFRTMGVRISLSQLAEEVPLPCILHWNQHHFVVCYSVKSNKKGKVRVRIADPASGKTLYHEDDFVKCWASSRQNGQLEGLALLVEPRPDFYAIKDEAVSSRRSIAFFAQYFLPYWKKLLWSGTLLLCGTLFQVAFPFLTQALVDVGIQHRNVGYITLILIAQLILFSSQMIADFVRSRIMLYINTKVSITLISDFLTKLMKLPIRFFDTKNTGDIMQRIADHDRIRQFLIGSSINIMFSSLTFTVFAAILGYYHSLILLIFLLGNSLYVSWIWYFMRYRRKLDICRFNLSAAEQSNIIQLIQGMSEIKMNNCERQQRWIWERIQLKLYKISLRSLQLGQVQQLGSLFFSQVTNIIITFIAAKAVVDNTMTLGMMMSLTYIIGQVSAPVRNFISFAQEFQDAKISTERLNEVHQKEDEEKDIQYKQDNLEKGQDIIFRDVSFSYSGAHRDYALEKLSITIPAGQVTAIVGTSGSGKTTLVKLLQGFYEPLDGVIQIGDTPLNQINPHTWRSKIGSVMQDGFIFSDTIAKNIALGEETIDGNKLLYAAKTANIDDYIQSLPLKYYTKIGNEGNGLSQGQRQRILIARAVYKNPEYLFLDEATNSLDTRNEQDIMDNLSQFFAGKTVVIVAHRLSTVKNADQIIVIDKGKIVEQGTHKTLIDAHGDYYTLVKSQLDV